MKRPVYNPDWSDDVKRVYHHDLEEVWEPSLNPIVYRAYQHRLKMFLRLIEQEFKPGNRILDVGCAQATLSLLLAERGYRVVALDVRKGFLDYARSRYEKGDIEFVCGDFLKTDFLTKFDVIVISEVIEHVYRPFEFLKRAYDLLKKGGMLLITTPNQVFFRNKNPTFREIVKRGVSSDIFNCSADGDMHFFAFTPHELYILTRKSGFVDIHLKLFHSFLLLGHFKTGFIHGIFSSSFISFIDRMINHHSELALFLSEEILLTGRK